MKHFVNRTADPVTFVTEAVFDLLGSLSEVKEIYERKGDRGMWRRERRDRPSKSTTTFECTVEENSIRDLCHLFIEGVFSRRVDVFPLVT